MCWLVVETQAAGRVPSPPKTTPSTGTGTGRWGRLARILGGTQGCKRGMCGANL
jgi:hypothetical protein